MIGTILDEKYRIDRLLGRGGMGAVYVAEDVRTGQAVAVKVISAQIPGTPTDIAARFERETRAAAALEADHIARCLDAGTDAATKQPFMVLELLAGEDLHRVLKRTGALDPDLALRVAAQACMGLASAHDAGVIHRDIKPANLFLAKRGDGERVVKLLDFGVAKIIKEPGEEATTDDGLTRTGSMIGSPMYMSPEQARSVKHIDHRSDLWSLGVVLYQALAGRTPFKHIAGIGDLVLALWSEPPPPVQQFAPWVPMEVAALLDRALRVEPDERFQSAREMFNALSALLPDGLEIRESMLVPISEEAKAEAAPTFFRRIDTKSRPLARPRTDPTLSRPKTGPAPQDTPAPARPAPVAVPEPTPVPLAAPHVAPQASGTSSPPGPATENGLSTTGSAARESAAPPSRKKMVVTAVVGLLIGLGGFFLFTRSPAESGRPAGPVISAVPSEPGPAAGRTAAVSPEPSVAPAPSAGAVVAPSAGPTASAAVTASAGANATFAPTAPRPAEATSTRPKSTAAPSVTASASAAPPAPTTRPFTDFGDRK